MSQINCIFCQLPFAVPAARCPHCGSALSGRLPQAAPQAANDDVAPLELEALEEDFEIVPLGSDASFFSRSPVRPPAPAGSRRPS